MKLIYTHPNPMILGNAQNLLQNAGIETIKQNEYSMSAAGELSAIDSWPEIWIIDDEEYSRAMHILQPILHDDQPASWQCSSCNETNEGSFEHCWNCQHLRPNH